MRLSLLSTLFVVCTTTVSFAQSATDSMFEKLSAGTSHSLFIRNGLLYATGQNVYGQLGIANKADALQPQQVAGNDYLSVSTCTYNTVALKKDGSIWAWGYNNYGEVGNGNRTHQFSPSRVGKDTNWISVTAGESFCLAIKRNGSLWGWGINSSGELGTGGNPYNSLTPIQIGKENNWKMAVAGVKYVLAIKKDGTLWAWGANAWGMLGTGDTTSRNTPTQIGIDKNWAFVAAGQSHSLAIKTDGSLWAWGSN